MLQNEPLEIDRSLRNVRQLLMNERQGKCHWTGELSASALSTATAVSALSFYLDSGYSIGDTSECNLLVEGGLRWLIEEQNVDGGWGDTDKNYSNISTTMLVIAAFESARQTDAYKSMIEKARSYTERQGGVDGIRKRYGDDKTFAVPILANAAMAGLVDWKEVGVLPFEAACVPQRFYNLLNLPVVSYAIPALVAIGQAKFHFDPPKNPLIRWLRKHSIKRSLKVLERMQPSSGGFLEAIPLTSFVCMALIKCDRADHPVVQNGIRFLKESFRKRENGLGTWPIDTNLATWVTTLSMNAVGADKTFQFEKGEDDDWRSCIDWVLSCQNSTKHPFTGAEPGGWGWTDLTGAVPDSDDTPGALLAMRCYFDRVDLDKDLSDRLKASAQAGLNWLIGLQNRDGGWPTFCRGWGRLPFDRSGSDLTAHVIRALVAWKDEIDAVRCDHAIESGFKYLDKNQQKDGSWLPLWFGNQDCPDEINPFYGTAKVLQAYNSLDRLHTHSARNGLKWIRENQNQDGGWGGGKSLSWRVAELGTSSVEETALCTEALLYDSQAQSQQAAVRGVKWLQMAIDNQLIHHSSPIGFYFAKLWYFEKLYPLIFATSALGVAKSLIEPERL